MDLPFLSTKATELAQSNQPLQTALSIQEVFSRFPHEPNAAVECATPPTRFRGGNVGLPPEVFLIQGLGMTRLATLPDYHGDAVSPIGSLLPQPSSLHFGGCPLRRIRQLLRTWESGRRNLGERWKKKNSRQEIASWQRYRAE
jgi:hypothetical protein